MVRPVVPMEYMGEEYFKLKASIIKYERFVLKELGFCVHVKHPHKIIIAYLQILDLERNVRLAQKAWNCMNDSLRTNVFVRFTPEAIASACIFLSARQLKIPLPQKPPWWTVFDITFEDIEAISMEIVALYRRPRAFLIDLEKKLNVIKEEFSKKQVQIKEVNLRKTSPGSSEVPSVSLSPLEASKEKGSFESPSLPLQSKLQPTPLTQSLSQKTSPVDNFISPTSASNLITNGGKTKNSISPSNVKRARQTTTTTSSPCPPAPKRRKLCSSPEVLTLPITEKIRGLSEESNKPVISPIRIAASSGESYSDASGSTPRENGIPEQYRRDFTNSSKHHRHRHRHHRSTKPHQTKPHQERRHHHQRDRERERKREEGGRHNRRGRDNRSSKTRRTDLERYR